MQDTSLNSAPVKYNKPIIYFLLLWALLNAVQAFTLEIHADEAYYWVYSRFLDWGYYDHPPMVAVFIKAGYSLIHNEFGVRLFTVMSTTASLYLMWLMLKRYRVDAINFILVVSGIFVFHIYGFTTTPDAPLLFFTVLFLYFYQQYIEEDSLKLAIILGVVIACLLYSKYHGILLVAFTLVSNIKLLKRGSFYGIVLLALALYAPHILWQVNHDYPSISYHLSERSADDYQLDNTYLYPLGQLIMAGPLIGWFLFYKGFTTKIQDVFTRTLLVNSAGILAFFFSPPLKVKYSSIGH
ncbi:ArnT family glycosyltransferase [Mucilaginibacter sp. P25]|uniref:ArnT family glycosyltransferase n=1 Tax=Mucilaginibacter sp. P25 TaxID=3423945 RepID=UPI003D795477